MQGHVLVLNTGSSSIKTQLFDAQMHTCFNAQLSGIDSERPCWRVRIAEQQTREIQCDAPMELQSALDFVLEQLAEMTQGLTLSAIGHRVVHGGDRFADPCVIDATALDALEALVPLAPLHQPFNLAGMRACLSRWPTVKQVACFDTAFHQTQPPVARRIALPQAFAARGIRRYGFHGLSYAYIARRSGELLPGCERVIVAHLGSGASLCALRKGVSVDTTMGFTALDGLVMGSRCGALDPGVILHLLTEERMTPDAVTDLLYRRSGLLGVSGLSADMRSLLASDKPEAAEAVALFVYRCQKELGALIAVLGGLDALVFTAGIGEHQAEIRARICAGFDWLGLHLDDGRNATATGECAIHAAHSAVQTWVIPTNEELEIARACMRLV